MNAEFETKMLSSLEEQGKLLKQYDEITKKKFETIDEESKARKEWEVKADKTLSELKELINKGNISLPGADPKKFSITKLIGSAKSGDWTNAGYEKEVCTEASKKNMSWTSGTDGGYLVPMEVIPGIVEMSKAASVMDKVGATFLSGVQGGTVQMTKKLSGTSISWSGEGVVGTTTEPKFGMITMSPKKMSCLAGIPNELEYLGPNVDQIVLQDIAEEIALERDRVALLGSGSDFQPRGLVNISGVHTYAIGTNGGPLTLGKSRAMRAAIEAYNIMPDSLGYIFHSNVKNILTSERIENYSGQVAGNYVNMFVTDEILRSLIGNFGVFNNLPITLTKNAGSNLSYAFLGAWAQLLIAEWNGIKIKIDDPVQTDITYIRVTKAMDCNVRNADAFQICADASADIATYMI